MTAGLVTIISVIFIQVILGDASFGRVDSAVVGCWSADKFDYKSWSIY